MTEHGRRSQVNGRSRKHQYQFRAVVAANGMSNAYSTDLRERVVAYVANGGKKAIACQLFQVGHDTVYRWMQQHREMGHVEPKARGNSQARKLNQLAPSYCLKRMSAVTTNWTIR